MTTRQKNVANAIGGKTARACDSCIIKRARWYCTSDDAFLCQSCDSSVHLANPSALRHQRVRLKTASLKSLDIEPSWNRGFTRKPRTPRTAKILSDNKSKHLIHTIPFVPELASDEDIEQEQQLLYRVPIFDPYAAELCTSTTTTTNILNDPETPVATPSNGVESRECFVPAGGGGFQRQDVKSIHGFVPSDMDLADFSADVESLLGGGLENECFRMEELGLADLKEEEEEEEEELHCLEKGKVKLEEEEKNEQQRQLELELDSEIDMAKEPPFKLSFEYGSSTCGEEEEQKKETDLMKKYNKGECETKTKKNKKKKKRKVELSLDYDAVISAWASQGCPWTGNRPEVDLDDECWPETIMGNWGGEAEQHGDGGGIGGEYPGMAGGGREARVSRYREKRRTRLFSKKIRYEVRKVNAEKRPRMKGRFVKRATAAAAADGLH